MENIRVPELFKNKNTF